MHKIYNPKQIEESIYNFWEHRNYFQPHKNIDKKNYCIIMPPPNITGQLHLGHAFQQTIMDTLIRYQRMRGKNTLWQTGIDHAGIAAQMLVENQINTTQNTKKNFSRNETIKKIWKWKKQSEKIINYQMKRLGNSVDWKKKRFTMDAGMSYAVREAFIRLYQENLIYKGKKIINWDPTLQTAISDLEVSYKKTKNYMWYIHYPIEKNSCSIKEKLSYLTVATTRPETILGDTAVAINPEDSRYIELIGRYVIIPIINRRIPIIYDQKINMQQGTGCVKITPGHDFNDYNIGKNHNLPIIKIFSSHGTILKKSEIYHDYNQSEYPKYYNVPKMLHDLSITQARQTIINQLNQLNLIHTVKTYDATIPYNDRTNAIIEPMLTTQWYIRTKKLAQQAIQAIELDVIKFFPHQYKNMYLSWMQNIQDWCISRQIWWGHRIPAWYDYNKNIYVGHCEKNIRISYKLNKNITLNRDKDVLDTWFSSSLWAFSSLGWPKNTYEFNTFYPTNTIISGFDIIFFWIARMIMLSMHFIKNESNQPQVPFKTIYITGLIRDEIGNKMSKSKGNVIDPIDIIDGISIKDLLKKRTHHMLQPKLTKKIIQNTTKNFPNGIKPHGSDALRFTLMALASSGRDINWDMKRLKGYHNFCNKLWQVSHFIINHTINQNCHLYVTQTPFSLPDRWITTKLFQAIQDFHLALKIYRFDKITNILHTFIWHQFCDWYIESIKPILYHGNGPELKNTKYTLIKLLESILRLAHPVIPFITEKIWQEIKGISKKNGDTIMYQPFPQENISMIDQQSIIDWEQIKNIVTSIRTMRINLNINNSILLDIKLKNFSSKIKELVINNYHSLLHMARLKCIHFMSEQKINDQHIVTQLNDAELLIVLPECFNKNLIIDQLTQKIQFINHKIITITNNINNKNFMNHAPKNVINKINVKLDFYKKNKNKLLSLFSKIEKL